MTPETMSRLSILRAKVAEGSITLEELKEGVKLMREDREVSSKASANPRRAKAKAEIKSADEMLDELANFSNS